MVYIHSLHQVGKRSWMLGDHSLLHWFLGLLGRSTESFCSGCSFLRYLHSNSGRQRQCSSLSRRQNGLLGRRIMTGFSPRERLSKVSCCALCTGGSCTRHVSAATLTRKDSISSSPVRQSHGDWGPREAMHDIRAVGCAVHHGVPWPLTPKGQVFRPPP